MCWQNLALLPVLGCFHLALRHRAKLQAFSVLPFQQTTDLVEKLRAQNVAFEELILPDEIHDLLRWNDWVRAYRATAEFFDRKLAAFVESLVPSNAAPSSVSQFQLFFPSHPTCYAPCLIRMSELYPHHRVITADKDFRVYRRNKREVIPLICPP